MPLKHHGTGDELAVVHRWDGGITWMAHPDEGMERASHALLDGDDVWLVDPLDADGLDAELDALGSVAGVVVLTNSHGRHADRLAERHGVPIHVPVCFGDVGEDFDAPVETFDEELADTGFELVWQKEGTGWKEGALYHPDRRTLVVPDALMTSLFTGENGHLELFPLFKRSPPQDALGTLDVDRVLVGHGEPVVEDAQAALDEALSVGGLAATASIAKSVPTFARIVYMNVRGES